MKITERKITSIIPKSASAKYDEKSEPMRRRRMRTRERKKPKLRDTE